MSAQFIDELNNLLEKYNASIVWGCSDYSDLHGVTGQYMQVQTKGAILLHVDGDCISTYEINQLKD